MIKLNNKTKAIVKGLDLQLSYEQIKELDNISDTTNTIEVDGIEIYCLTDNEADDLWDNMIDDYIDDCVLPDLPEAYRFYFDDEAFKRDCSFDGRGHTIASYDGNETEVKIGNEWYYIYRTN